MQTRYHRATAMFDIAQLALHRFHVQLFGCVRRLPRRQAWLRSLVWPHYLPAMLSVWILCCRITLPKLGLQSLFSPYSRVLRALLGKTTPFLTRQPGRERAAGRLTENHRQARGIVGLRRRGMPECKSWTHLAL